MTQKSNDESYHRTQTRLLEIYKIQLDSINNISNRRVNINRHYLLIMSGLMIALTAFARLDEADEKGLLLVRYSPMIIGTIGLILSWSWLYMTDSYLRRNSRKYEVLKHLESQLEYQFLSKEWGTLGIKNVERNYRSLASVEFILPTTFYVLFNGLCFLGVTQVKMINEIMVGFFTISVILIGIFLYFSISSHINEKNETRKIRKTYRKQ